MIGCCDILLAVGWFRIYMKRRAAFECRTLICSARLCGLEYCRGCFKETFEMVSEKGRFQWRGRLPLLSNLHAEVF